MAIRNVLCFGNSHIWGLFPPEFTGRNDVQMLHSYPELQLCLEGYKLGTTGATAYGLINANSVTQAGKNLEHDLDAHPEPDKVILMLFGEVDVSSHIAGKSDPSHALWDCLSRYISYLDRLLARADVGSLLVVSTIAHHQKYGGEHGREIADISLRWNSELHAWCRQNVKAHFVDFYTPFLGTDGFLQDRFARDPNDPHENHMAGVTRQLLEMLCTTLAGTGRS